MMHPQRKPLPKYRSHLFMESGHGDRQDQDVNKCSDVLETTQNTVTLTETVPCTPPPQQTPTTVEKTYKHKRSREEDDSEGMLAEENVAIASLCKERSKTAKRLKFDPRAVEK